MIACVSPSIVCYEETSNTLKYASKAKNIKRKVVKNVKEVQAHISEYKGIIDSLKAEIQFLQAKLQEKERESPTKAGGLFDPNVLSRIFF
jgi:kinesin family protein 18/19